MRAEGENNPYVPIAHQDDFQEPVIIHHPRLEVEDIINNDLAPLLPDEPINPNR